MPFLETLDPRTLAASAAIAGYIFSFAFWATLRDEERLPGPEFWLLTALLSSTAFTMRAFQDFAPDLLTRAAANVMLISAVFFLWHGARVFYRRKTVSIAWPLLGTLFGVASNFVFVALIPSTAARVGITSLALAAGAALAVGEFWHVRAKHRSPGVVLAGLALAVIASLLLVHASLSLIGASPPTSIERSAFNIASHLLGVVLFMCTLTGLLMAVNAMRASQVRALAYIDQLTGVLGRRGFFSATKRLASRTFPGGVVFVFDVNEFKRINDTKGHETGDNILRVLTSSIRQYAPPKSLIARFGGDEFIVFAREVESPEAMTEQVKAAFSARSASVLAQRTLLQSTKTPLTLASVAVGWAACTKLDEASFSFAMHQADREMYRVKIRRRGQNEPRLDNL